MRLRNREIVEEEGDSERGPELSTKDMKLKRPPKNRELIHEEDDAGLSKDRSSILLLVFLYILQGIPLGLAGSMPMVLHNKGISYKQQAVFSFVFWPFSLKLLWAPIVDSVYLKSFGRRKTWLVPTQYLIGIFMLVLSMVRGLCCFSYLFWKMYQMTMVPSF